MSGTSEMVSTMFLASANPSIRDHVLIMNASHQASVQIDVLLCPGFACGLVNIMLIASILHSNLLHDTHRATLRYTDQNLTGDKGPLVAVRLHWLTVRHGRGRQKLAGS